MKILVCVDGSEHSFAAVEMAGSIASNLQAVEIAVLHVYMNTYVPTTVGEGYFTEEMQRRIKEQLHEEGESFLETAKKLLERKGFEVKVFLKEGHVASTIIETAAEGGFDLIVMGSRGIGGFKKLLLGSVSNAVAHEASTSVLIVKLEKD